MATKTTNYNLIKPALTDDADIRVINGNMDVLDTQLKTISDKAGTATNNAYTNVSVNNNYEWKFTKGSGANVSFDTIKNATNATALTGTTSTYKVPTDSSKYSKLEYWYGTLPYKGSTTGTTDSGVLKFNHWGSAAWNSAFVPNNSSSRRPYMMYQNGTAGEYSVFKEFAWKDDVDTKLGKEGGTLTGALYTNNSIFKNSNNGVLVLGGSTDATHGARINLSGEKHTNAGLVKITADNGTNTNVFEVTTDGSGSQYNFNGLITYMNSNDDYFRLGGIEAYFRLDKSNKWLRTNASRMQLNGISCDFNTDTDYFIFGTNRDYLACNKNGKLYFNRNNEGNKVVQIAHEKGTGETWYMETDTLLIQGGTWIPTSSDWYINLTLPRPYPNTNYTLLNSCNTTRSSGGLSDRNPTARKISNTTIQLSYYADREVAWMTVGVK